jgi:hypothetical protein
LWRDTFMPKLQATPSMESSRRLCTSDALIPACGI